MRTDTYLPIGFVVGTLCALARAGGVTHSVQAGRSTCTVTANGNQTDDVPHILQAFETCGNDGLVIFPEDQSYWIAQKLNPILHNVEIEWRGQWTMSADLGYWRNNSYPIAFQNHHAGIIFTGDGIHINGFGTGGINGNGNTWYNAEQAVTQPGRPMPFVWWNVSDVTVKHFFVKQPPLWSINIMNGTDMWFDDIYVNATALQAPFGDNWVQNTDGFDTMDTKNIRLTNFVYQGGDDCIAVKPRSYNIFVQNMTCHGGNGPAIGSLGQYLEDSSVIDVLIKDVHLIRVNDDLHNTALIKTWIGVPTPQSSYESAGLPRGGGWGVVQNIRFENFFVEGTSGGPAINEDSGNNGSFSGSSLMEVSNVAFVNMTGWTADTTTTASVSCSTVKPCFNIVYQNVSLTPDGPNGTLADAKSSCKYIAPGGVRGLNSSSCLV